MILIDMKVDALEAKYDFSVDENSHIAVLIEEIGEMITQREQCEPVRDYKNIQIFTPEGRMLNPAKTLSSYNIKDGDTLIMI